MKKYLNRRTLQISAAFFLGYIQTAGQAKATTFSSIATNMTTSMADLPGLLSALAYLFGLMIGVLGVLKIKDHVENPNNTPLKDGAIRLAAGGSLFALPFVYNAMLNTIGNGDTSVGQASLTGVSMGD